MHPDDVELDLALDSDEEASEDSAAPADPLGDVLLRSGVPLFERPSERSPRPPAAEPRSLFPTSEERNAPAEINIPADRAAPLAGRVTAFATDAILCTLWSVAALVAAALATGRTLAPAAWLWSGAFAILLSFFLVVPTLLIFGRTPGMALADLTAAAPGDGVPPAGACAVRWAATLVTVALAGLPLFGVVFDTGRRSPADRLSGWPLRQL